MISPHTGVAGFWLGGSFVQIKFDWQGLSRLQGRFGEGWLEALSEAVRDMDAIKMSLAIECVALTPVQLSPSFSAGLDDAALVVASNLEAALSAAFSGPASLSEAASDEAEPDEPEPEPEPERPSEAKWIEDALVTAVAAGISPTEFWQLTPYQTGISIRGAAERIKAEQRQIIAGAWFGEMFARQKKLQKLEEFFRDADDRTSPIPDGATPDQAVAILRASLGGADGGS